ncbi:MAG: hypothetical protein ACRDTV_00715 [Mycobacterium sp.]
MEFSEVLEQLPVDGANRRVYGEPYRTADGATVITVANLRGAPIGAFVIAGNKASWVGVVDTNRIALLGVLTGLASAVIGSLAVLRRPPWPDLRDYGR